MPKSISIRPGDRFEASNEGNVEKISAQPSRSSGLLTQPLSGSPVGRLRNEGDYMVGKSRESLYGSTDRGILQAIGLAVVNFSQMEEWLALGVNCLVTGKRYNDAADLIVSKLQARSLLEVFSGLYRHRFPDDDFGDLNKLCHQLERLNEERNRLVHSFWAQGKEADQLRRYKTAVRRSGPKTWDENVREADVLIFAEEVEQACALLLEFVGDCILQRIDDVINPRR